MKKTALTINLLIILFSTSCGKESQPSTILLNEKVVTLPTHKLTAFVKESGAKYLVVFECGLGDDHTIWEKGPILSHISEKTDILLYDRAGYGKSPADFEERNIAKLRSELETTINQFSQNRQVILVGHSLAGMILRDYAIKNPNKTAGLLLIDPSHEYYNQLDQSEEDMIYNLFLTNYGDKFGGTLEARSLIEDAEYSATLPNLPNVPTIVITSMKTDANHTSEDRQEWYKAHELLGTGLSDFKHITTVKSGHYIMVEEPQLIIESFDRLLSKLPQ